MVIRHILACAGGCSHITHEVVACPFQGLTPSHGRAHLRLPRSDKLAPLTSTEEKIIPSLADYRRKKNLFDFDHQIHQKLATDVIGVSFDAQRYEVFDNRHGKSACHEETDWESPFIVLLSWKLVCEAAPCDARYRSWFACQQLLHVTLITPPHLLRVRGVYERHQTSVPAFMGLSRHQKSVYA